MTRRGTTPETPRPSAPEAGPPGPAARNFAVAYLNVLIDDADQEELTAALGRIARVSGGQRLVEKVEINAPSLYRTLCRRGNPELRSVATLLEALGIRFALQPLCKGPSRTALRNRDAEDTAARDDTPWWR